MHNFIRNTQYLAPKWRAYVTPFDRGFLFVNGLRVRSLWELKEALLTFSEDVINPHIKPGENQIASWVRSVVGDSELADELNKHSHRWGLVVALERQMMRTLNLPEYVASRWLRKVDNSFVFSDENEIWSLRELAKNIESISSEAILFHYQRHPNDLSVWLSDIVGDYYLAESLEEVGSKDQIEKIIIDHLEMLEDAVS